MPVPEPIATVASLDRWVQHVEATLATLPAWRSLPAARHRSVVALATHLARHVQEEATRLHAFSPRRAAFNHWFTRLSEHSKAERPGFVNGLMASHRPSRGSWLEDARRARAVVVGDTNAPGGERPPSRAVPAGRALLQGALDGVDDATLLSLALGAVNASDKLTDAHLCQALAPRYQVFVGASALKPLVKRLKRLQGPATAPNPAESSTSAEVLPDDWPGFAFTEGKRVLALGGDERFRVVDRWTETFRFADVDWNDGLSVRRVDAVKKRVASGQLELVVIIRDFIGHKSTNKLVKACKAVNGRFVVVDKGYGVVQVRQAIERYLVNGR